MNRSARASRPGCFLRRNWPVLLAAVGMVPIAFLLALMLLTYLFAPEGWNELCVPFLNVFPV